MYDFSMERLVFSSALPGSASIGTGVSSEKSSCDLCNYDCLSVGTAPRMMLHALRLHVSLLNDPIATDELSTLSTRLTTEKNKIVGLDETLLHSKPLPGILSVKSFNAAARDGQSSAVCSKFDTSDEEDSAEDNEISDDNGPSSGSTHFVFEAPDPFLSILH